MATNISGIIEQIKAAQNQANAQNMRQYQQMIQYINNLGKQLGSQGLYGQARKLAGTLGGAARADIAESAEQARGQSEQDLISRGLSGTTVREAAKRGISSDEQRALARQTEMETSQQANLLTQQAQMQMGLGGMRLAAMGSRQTQGPDIGQFASLVQSAAAAPSKKRTVTRTISSKFGSGWESFKKGW